MYAVFRTLSAQYLKKLDDHQAIYNVLIATG